MKEKKRELNRRSFLNHVAGMTAAGLALTQLPGCDFGGSFDDDFSMHGPVRTDEKFLKMPKASAAAGLFAPYENGEPFSRNWAIAAVVMGHQNQLIVVVVECVERNDWDDFKALIDGGHSMHRISRHLNYLTCLSVGLQQLQILEIDAVHNLYEVLLR